MRESSVSGLLQGNDTQTGPEGEQRIWRSVRILRQPSQKLQSGRKTSFLPLSSTSRTPNHPVTTSSKQQKTCQEVEMGESIGPASGLSCAAPFIVASNIDKVDPATRKLIRRHVMRGKKRKKAGGPGAAGLALIQNHGRQIRLQEVLDMYTQLQPGCFGTHRYFVDFPDEIDPSILWHMGQGAWRTGLVMSGAEPRC